jgi:hypothetical protein
LRQRSLLLWWRGSGYANVRERRHANQPPFCVYCGISANAPREQTRLACARNPDGIGHKYAWGPPENLPPPTRETLEAAVLDDVWGDSRYRPESDWNAAEGRAYLKLHRRDAGAQGFHVRVFDPSGVQSDGRDFGAADRAVLVWYPDDFAGAPPIVTGTYRVRWKATIDRGGKPSLEEVASDTFVIS